MVDKTAKKVAKPLRKTLKNQGTSALDFLLIIVIVLTVFGFLATLLLGGGDSGSSTANASANTTTRSAPVSSTTPYPYSQPATTYTQPTYNSYAQNGIQGRAGLNSVTSDINSGSFTTTTGNRGLAATVAGSGIVAANTAIANTTVANNFAVNQQQNTGTYGVGLNGEVIGLNPIQPLAAPYIPTTAPAAPVTGRSAITPESNPSVPYVNNNAAIYIETPQAYRPQNQELVMNQACVNEVWQRNPFVIRAFSNLSVRLSAANQTTNGNMRTYSFNLDNRPTGNGALCTVTNDGYVTAVSFY